MLRLVLQGVAKLRDGYHIRARKHALLLCGELYYRGVVA